MSVPTHQQDLIALLEERGFVHQCTDRDGLAAHLAAGPATAYLGFDATADSLHIGHLQGLMLMRWLQKAGHRPLLLIGGATTRIGDPSFRDSSRPILTEAQIQANIDGIARVFSRYVELHDDSLVNNAEWLGADDGAYSPEAMTAAVLENRYDLQYVLYLLALHRQLKARLPDYDYDRHMGGAVYLFLRGARAATQGLHFERPPRELIERLDALFSGQPGAER